MEKEYRVEIKATVYVMAGSCEEAEEKIIDDMEEAIASASEYDGLEVEAFEQ